MCLKMYNFIHTFDLYIYIGEAGGCGQHPLSEISGSGPIALLTPIRDLLPYPGHG